MHVASLFNLAGPDLIIILSIVLILFGAKRLPELFGAMGEAVREFVRAWQESAGCREKESAVTVLNRLFVPIAIVIFLVAWGLWAFGKSR